MWGLSRVLCRKFWNKNEASRRGVLVCVCVCVCFPLLNSAVTSKISSQLIQAVCDPRQSFVVWLLASDVATIPGSDVSRPPGVGSELPLVSCRTSPKVCDFHFFGPVPT